MKNQKGITLVALVVTVVVLLILAGVTIVLVMQGDSIFGKADEAATKTNEATLKHSVELAIAEVQVQYYAPDGTIAVADTAEAKATAAKAVATKSLAGTGIDPEKLTFTFTLADSSATPAVEAKMVVGGSVAFKGTDHPVVFDTSANAGLTVDGK